MTRYLLAAALGVSACSSVRPAEAPYVPEGLLLTADRADYERGDSARLLLRNGAPTAAQTGALECARIEAWNGDAWAPSPAGDARACTLALHTVRPGGSLVGAVPLDLPSGTYRLTQSVGFEAREIGVTAATAPFRVR